MTTNVHGALDYLFGAALVATPWLFGYAGIGGPETWVPVILGLGIIVYSLLTDYEWGVIKLIDVRAHIALDIVAGATLLISLIFFGFYDATFWTPYIILGALAVIGGLVTEPHPRSHRPRLSAFRQPTPG